jgi:hypothetical protein
MVGNGEDSSHRSNAFEVDVNGKGTFKSTVNAANIPSGTIYSSENLKSVTAITVGTGAVSQQINIRKDHNVVTFTISLYDANQTGEFAIIDSGSSIGVVPSGYRPFYRSYTAGILQLGSTAWATSNKAIVMVSVDTDGTIKIYGSNNDIHNAEQLVVTVTYVAAD